MKSKHYLLNLKQRLLKLKVFQVLSANKYLPRPKDKGILRIKLDRTAEKDWIKRYDCNRIIIMNKKIIFSDLDGTLIGENGKIPVSARNACMRALEKGHLLYIATGRPRCEIDDEILTAINFTGIISAGGGQIDVEGSTIFKAAFSTRVLSHIIEFFDRYKTGCIFERQDSILV